MSYDPNIPQPNDLLSDSQGDIQQNFLSANTSFGVNHFPFDNLTASNGKHKWVDLIVGSDRPPTIGQGTLFSKVAGIGSDAQLFWRFANGALSPLQITNNFFSPNANPGYIPLMAGLMLAYGSVGASSATSVPVAFAAAAPFSLTGVATAPYFVTAIPIRAATNPGDSMSTAIVTGSVTSTGFNIANIGGHSMAGWYWAAIGPKIMTLSSQHFESYVPVYDTVPEKWEDAREFLVEHLKKISNAVNIREIGWFLDEELLSGKAFLPGLTVTGNSQQFRSVLRKVIDFSPLVVGVNSVAHGIVFDSNFTLLQLYAAATDSVALTAIPIPNSTDSIDMDATNININSSAAYDRCFAVCEYIQEV